MIIPTRDDAEVIERARREPSAFAELFDRHAPALHRYVTRRLGDSLADDVVAGTFLVAFRKVRRYDTAQRDARPWLYGIAANLIAKHRRAEVRAYTALARTGVDEVADGYADRVAARVSTGAGPRRCASCARPGQQGLEGLTRVG
ncbi:RNA polymerase sigma factor [Nonomuraea dietziae]|uniref:RNA polymerase sigma factor n=1 Tax=Nonomuraea dietziae TaxID=65515 RepID=UPI003433C1E0